MSAGSYYKPGDFNAVCFLCGKERKASELRKHWQGYYVCPEHWEPRHPQDFVRGIPDNQSPPFVQPEIDDFVNDWCTRESCIADCAVADYAICDGGGRGCQQRFAISDVAVCDCAVADYTLNFSMDLFCTLQSRLCFADLALCDCAIADRTY